jgi:predicted nucleic acid-binding Zn ribbon protein
MDERLCPECGTALRGRVDKKFCSDMCRNAFNNKVNSNSNNLIRNVNHILRKNRRLLEENLQGETTKVSRIKLSAKGFDFNYYTNQSTTKNNHTYIFCYEYGYLPLENDYILIVKRKTESH